MRVAELRQPTMSPGSFSSLAGFRISRGLPPSRHLHSSFDVVLHGPCAWLCLSHYSILARPASPAVCWPACVLSACLPCLPAVPCRQQLQGLQRTRWPLHQVPSRLCGQQGGQLRTGGWTPDCCSPSLTRPRPRPACMPLPDRSLPAPGTLSVPGPPSVPLPCAFAGCKCPCPPASRPACLPAACCPHGTLPKAHWLACLPVLACPVLFCLVLQCQANGGCLKCNKPGGLCLACKTPQFRRDRKTLKCVRRKRA